MSENEDNIIALFEECKFRVVSKVEKHFKSAELFPVGTLGFDFKNIKTMDAVLEEDLDLPKGSLKNKSVYELMSILKIKGELR